MKTIGLDGSRAFLKYRTGIEEYSYQVIKHLRDYLTESQVRLYVRKKLRFRQGRLIFVYPEIDFSLPPNWELCGIWAPRFWTQLGLSLQMLFRPVETLFVPAHTLPLIGGKRNVVTVHGLEYEVSPESYGFWERLYMRYSIRYSCWKADTVIAVSENTKKDLIKLYDVVEEKTQVVYEGYRQELTADSVKIIGESEHPSADNYQLPAKSYVLFIGRIEERKNVSRIIEAFELLKERYAIPHQLVLVGKTGYGYQSVKCKMQNAKFKDDIQELGYVTNKEKGQLLANASAFIFPSLYEGFGLPILEAQSYGIPVVTSCLSSLPEVGGEGALYADPYSPTDIADKLYQALTLTDEAKIIFQEKMKTNLKQFSWENCAEDIAQVVDSRR